AITGLNSVVFASALGSHPEGGFSSFIAHSGREGPSESGDCCTTPCPGTHFLPLVQEGAVLPLPASLCSTVLRGNRQSVRDSWTPFSKGLQDSIKLKARPSLLPGAKQLSLIRHCPRAPMAAAFECSFSSKKASKRDLVRLHYRKGIRSPPPPCSEIKLFISMKIETQRRLLLQPLG
ncbi:hypothetical protein STEG23_013856, partial [Scotinomys teguina]